MSTDVPGGFATRYGYTPIDPSLFGVYLAELEKTGSYTRAADACNWAPTTVLKFRKENSEFQELCDHALARYRDSITSAAYKRAVEGYQVPIVGGRERDRVVAEETRYSDTLMAMFLKRSDPEFREKHEVKVESTDGGFRAAARYWELSRRARDKLRELLNIVKEDEAARLRGEIVE